MRRNLEKIRGTSEKDVFVSADVCREEEAEQAGLSSEPQTF